MLETLTYILAAIMLIYVAVVDVRTRRIPNACVLGLVELWLIRCVILVFDKGSPEAMAWAASGVMAALVLGGGILLIAMLFERVTGKHSLGGGDIKLIAALALFLGIEGSLIMLLAASIFSLVGAFFLRQRTLPFAPFIASGTLVAFLI